MKINGIAYRSSIWYNSHKNHAEKVAKRMERCKYCGHRVLWKAGIVKEKQRFKCAHCKRVQVEKDTRYKYSERERNSALALYLEGIGFRQVARVMSKIFGKKYVYQTIIKWITKEGKQALHRQDNKPKLDIEVLEMDELYTFIKKTKSAESMDCF